MGVGQSPDPIYCTTLHWIFMGRLTHEKEWTEGVLGGRWGRRMGGGKWGKRKWSWWEVDLWWNETWNQKVKNEKRRLSINHITFEGNWTNIVFFFFFKYIRTCMSFHVLIMWFVCGCSGTQMEITNNYRCFPLTFKELEVHSWSG